jgi:hypothetical protein
MLDFFCLRGCFDNMGDLVWREAIFLEFQEAGDQFSCPRTRDLLKNTMADSSRKWSIAKTRRNCAKLRFVERAKDTEVYGYRTP